MYMYAIAAINKQTIIKEELICVYRIFFMSNVGKAGQTLGSPDIWKGWCRKKSEHNQQVYEEEVEYELYAVVVQPEELQPWKGKKRLK